MVLWRESPPISKRTVATVRLTHPTPLADHTCPKLVSRFDQPARLGGLDRRLQLLEQNPA
jgi:hypothetical protein